MDEAPDLSWHPLGELLVERGLVRPEDVRHALDIQERTGQLLGEILISRRLVSASDIARTLGEQSDVHIRRARWEWEHSLVAPKEPKLREDGSGTSHRLLGQVLLDRRLITEDGLVRALREQKHTGMLLGEILVKRRWLSAQDIERALAEQRGVQSEVEERASPVYEVREAGRIEPIARCSDFLEATDVTFDLLDSRDPDELVIVRIDGGSEECVWVYSRAAAAEVARMQA